MVDDDPPPPPPVTEEEVIAYINGWLQRLAAEEQDE